jgi:tetratricopeptide (TPR) repeat protein
MQRKAYEECKEQFLISRANQRWPDLVYWATELLQYDDTKPWVWANRGDALNKLGHPIDAILNYDRALKLENDPKVRAGILNNKGGACWDMFDAQKAMEYIYQAIDLYPLAESYMTLGHIHKYHGQLGKAIGMYRAAISVNPDNADCHLALGMALLKSGNLAEGWSEYEWRWKTDQLPARKLNAPQWSGQDLGHKTILVYGEQGLGDIIQFSRYVRVLGQRYPTAKIVVEGRPNLHRLLSTITEAHMVINAGEKLPSFDYAIPMLSLAGILTPEFKNIPASDNEFLIDRRDVERWKAKFDSANVPGKRVGVCWAGMSRTAQPVAAAIDSLRSMELQEMSLLMKVPGIFWISLQKGPSASQINTPIPGMVIGDFTDEMHDFYETCAAMAACDLVITVDTAVAHAAASIGRPTWMFSRWDGCWRWFGDRLTSPWYPTLLQFVQTKPRDWSGVVRGVAAELTRFVEK